MNKQIKKVLIISVVVVALAALYFQLILPALNFINNSIPSTGSTGQVVIDASQGVIDRTRPANQTPTPTVTPSAVPSGVTPGKDSPTPTPSKGVISEVISTDYVELKPGTKNILLLGADIFTFDDGDYGLADTMVILNIDTQSKVMKMVSLPRDAFVPYTDAIAKVLVDRGLMDSKGIFKINMVPFVGREVIHYTGGNFEESGISFLASIIEAMMGSATSNYKIDDYIFINFTGFMELVDIVGGVWVDVYEDIYDMHGNLQVPGGLQKLTSEKALFYARSRYRYNPELGSMSSPGDIYRKRNQLNMLIDISTQVLSVENLGRAKEILESLTRNVRHSLNTVDDLTEYVNIGYEYLTGIYSIESYVITGLDEFGNDIDPFGDSASYVNITTMTTAEIDAIVAKWRTFAN